MRRPDVERFLRELTRYDKVAIDTNVLIYHLEGMMPYVELTRALITQLAEGRLHAVVSVITLAELLVGPHRGGDSRQVALAREFVEGLPYTLLAEVDAQTADRAAALRTQGLRMPDAIIVATAIVHDAGAVISNDPGLRRPASQEPPVLLLDDYCPPG